MNNKASNGSHQPVLVVEAIEGLAVEPEGIYVDGTFGRGGHSRVILQQLSAAGRLVAIDKDLEAVAYAKAHFGHDPRFSIYHGSFASIIELSKQADILGRVNGILLDLGVSSPQLETAERGFSFMQHGPLDMRMDLTQTLDAAYFINHAEAHEMTRIFKEYGEERFANRIARAIVAARQQAPILDSKVLAEIVKAANPKWEKTKHPATRVFQAIRIHINQELTELKKFLAAALEVLAVNGRLAIISFHSLEDRIVKQFMRTAEIGNQLPRGLPVRYMETKTNFKRIGKAIKPEDNEKQQNNRARSAVLRVGVKTS